MSTPKRASEELLAAPLPELVEDLGMAVATANAALKKSGSDVVYTIPSAEIEVNVAISISKQTEVKAGLAVSVVNATYSNTFGFTEEASSKIKLTLKAVPKSASLDADGGAGADGGGE